MAAPRPGKRRRDPWTPTGSGRRLDDEFGAQEVPAFGARRRRPAWADPRLARRRRGAEPEES